MRNAGEMGEMEVVMGAIVIVDAFWGDSGKGKIGAFLASKHRTPFCVRAGTGTDAGHSMYLDNDVVLKTNQIPLAGILSDAQLRIGSGVAVDPGKFISEIERYDAEYHVESRTKVDIRCPVILPEYILREQQDKHLHETVGSTTTGTGVALSEYRLRRACQAKDIPELKPYLADVPDELNKACAEGRKVLVEGSQGTFLSLALTREYPYCTSDNCTTAAFIDDVGLNWKYIEEVVLVVKALPSRVGEGPLPFEIPAEQQDPRTIEYGVTTGRRRRKAARISWELLEEAVMLNGPTQIALTFCDHYDAEIRNRKVLTPRVKELIKQVERVAGVPITLVETGKTFDCIIEIQHN